MAIWKQDLFRDYHLCIGLFAGHAWSERAGFLLTVPEDATVNTVKYTLKCNRWRSTNIVGGYVDAEPCIELRTSDKYELNGTVIHDKPTHVGKVWILDGKAWTVIGLNEVRIAIYKVYWGDIAKIDAYYDSSVEIEYTIGASGIPISGELLKAPEEPKEPEGTKEPLAEVLTNPVTLILIGLIAVAIIITVWRGGGG